MERTGKSPYPEFRRFNFVVKTFGPTNNSASEATLSAAAAFQLFNEFEDSYFTLLNKKMSSIEGKHPDSPLDKKPFKSDFGFEKMEGVLGNIWFAEFNFPVDLASFRQIMTDAVYKMDCSAEPGSPQPSVHQFADDNSIGSITNTEIEVLSSSDGDMNSFSNSNAAEEILHNPGSLDCFSDFHSPKDTGTKKCSSPKPINPFFYLTRESPHFVDLPSDLDEISQPFSLDSTGLASQVVESLELSDSRTIPITPRRVQPMTPLRTDARGKDLSYIKTERFNMMLTKCPFLGGPKMYNSEIADQKARRIISKLLQEAESGTEVSEEPKALLDPEEEPTIVPYSPRVSLVDPDDEFEDPEDDLQDQSIPRRTRKRPKRIFSTRSTKRRRAVRKRMFLQKLNVLVDRLTSRYIDRKKADIIQGAFHHSLAEVFNGNPPGFSESSGDSFFDPNPKGTSKGHGRSLNFDTLRFTRDLDSSLREPFKIPKFPLEKIGQRETIKKMLQYYW